MKRLVVSAALLLAVAIAGASIRSGSSSIAADDKAAPKQKPELVPLKAFMRAKLASSEQVLDGIVTEDFDKIEKGTLRLQLITVAEEWKVSDSQHYLDQSAEFRKILSRLKNHAQKKNLDGATLTYLEMTMSCVRCHEDLRKPPASSPEKPEKGR